jgi:circadian clock protein KaiB
VSGPEREVATEGAPSGAERGAASGLRLRLYVAAAAPNSVQAQSNLRALLESAGAHDASVDVVDCIREPQRALRDGVLVTPTLLKLGPPPTCTIVGALSDRRAVLLALGLAAALATGPAPR